MAMYTFYLCDHEGSSTSFEAYDLRSEAEAADRALRVLAEHSSSAFVAAWGEEGPVLIRYRHDAFGRLHDRDRASMVS